MLDGEEHYEVIKVWQLPSGEMQATTIAKVVETTIWDVRDNTGTASQRIKDRAWVEVTGEG